MWQSDGDVRMQNKYINLQNEMDKRIIHISAKISGSEDQSLKYASLRK